MNRINLYNQPSLLDTNSMHVKVSLPALLFVLKRKKKRILDIIYNAYLEIKGKTYKVISQS